MANHTPYAIERWESNGSADFLQLINSSGALVAGISPLGVGYGGLANSGSGNVLVSSLTTNGATTYTITIPGLTASSHVSLTPTSASAAADWASGNVYVSSKSANTLVIATGATSGETFDILATTN